MIMIPLDTCTCHDVYVYVYNNYVRCTYWNGLEVNDLCCIPEEVGHDF